MRQILQKSMLVAVLLLSAWVVPQTAQAKMDPLAKYKLDLSDPNVCRVLYVRGGNSNYQGVDSVKLGVKVDGTDSLSNPKDDLKFLYDGKTETFAKGSNQSFFILDFGEGGIDLAQIRIWNDGYYIKPSNHAGHQNTTVFGGLYGDCTTGADSVDIVADGVVINSVKYEMFRTNNQVKNSLPITLSDKWVTGTVDSTFNTPGSFTATVNSGNHLKYRYVVVYDWSYTIALSEVEIWGIRLNGNTNTDKQIDLDMAITKAQAYVTEFAQSDETAVAVFQTAITDAQALLTENVTDEAQLATAINSLTTATETFMGSITYQSGENDYYCSITTPDGNYGLKMANEKTTVGGYTGYALTVCDPVEAVPFSIAKNSIINGQQAYQLSTENGVVIQNGNSLMLVDASQVTTTNTAKFVFSQRYNDGENALYDLKAGDYFYFIDGNTMASTEDFPQYSDFTEITNYLFQLTPSDYKKDPAEKAACFTSWEFNTAAVKATDVYGDALGKNAGVLIEGWRFNKWRSYTRLTQETVNGTGYMVASINNPFYDRNDTLCLTPMEPAIDTKSCLTSANNGIGLCREYGKYANAAAADPIDQIRDSSNLVIVNPIYNPYIAVKMAATADSVDLSNFSFSFFIKKGGVEPGMNMKNLAGKKGDVYYWRLADCGFTVGQVGYSAQYLGVNTMVKSCKNALVIDWIKSYESVDAIPEESIPATDLEAIVATLPETPVYEVPEDTRATALLDLSKNLSVVNAQSEDVTANYTSMMSKLYDGDKTTKLVCGDYFLITLPEDAQAFKSLTVYYESTSVNQYSNNVLFYKEDGLDISKDTYANYVPNAGGLWMHTAFSGTAETNEAALSTTFINTKNEKFTYIAIKGDNAENPMTMTEVELVYYPVPSIDLTACKTFVVDQNYNDKTANFTDQIVRASDKDKTVSIALNTKNFLVYDFGKNGAQVDSISFFNTGGGVKDTDYREDDFCAFAGELVDGEYTDAFNSKTDFARTNGNNGNKSFNVITGFDSYKAGGAYTVALNKQVRYISFYNWSGKFTASEVKVYGTLNPTVDSLSTWSLNSNWVSTRTGGTVTPSASNDTLFITAGTDNAKRGDIKNEKDEFYIGDHKIIYYLIEPTAAGVTVQPNDMKLTYHTLLKSFSDTAVVCEQTVKKGYEVLEDGYTLVWFDISATNPNTAYLFGQSSQKWNGDQKTAFRTALTAAKTVTLKNVSFVLIGNDATSFTIKMMGSAENIDIVKNALLPNSIETFVTEEMPVRKGIYDLFGRKLEQISAPGLYIIDGKKVLINR